MSEQIEDGSPPEDIVLRPEIPGPRYVINKTMAWACIGAAAGVGTMAGMFILIIVLVLTDPSVVDFVTAIR